MSRFEIPAFNKQNVQEQQVYPGIGYFSTQGRRFNPNGGRKCEDIVFAKHVEGRVTVGVLDGHGGDACAINVADYLQDELHEWSVDVDIGACPAAA